MKILIFVFVSLVSAVLSAEPDTAPTIATILTKMELRYETTNVRMVMPGVLYRGGTTAGTEPYMRPLGNASLAKLCDDGFAEAVYTYRQNWESGSGLKVTCAKGQLTYVDKYWKDLNSVHAILVDLQRIIVERKGAMYVHCWWGDRASGTVSAIALRQFCGWSAQEGLDYWRGTIPVKPLLHRSYESAVVNFKPDPSLNLTPEQRLRVCPKKVDKYENDVARLINTNVE